MPLPPGKIEFVNRTGELEFVNQLRDREDQAVPIACVIQAQPDSGVSRFLEEACQQSKDHAIAISISGSNGVAGSAFAQIALALFANYRQHYREFLRFSKRKFGSYPVLEYLPYIAAPVPYVGGITQAVLKRSLIDAKREFEQFPSILAGLTSEFLAEIATEERVALFIDDAQDLDPWSLELLEVTAASPYSRVRYFIAFADRNEFERAAYHMRLTDELAAFGYEVADFRFPSPESEFIEALANHAGLDIARDVVNEIEGRCEGRMRKVIREIRRLTANGHKTHQTAGAEDLSPIEAEIVSFLCKAKQSLRTSDLNSLCAETPDLFYEDVTEVDSAIRNLEGREIIEISDLPGGDQLVGLHSISDEAVQQLANDMVRQLRAAEQIYRFVNRQIETKSARHSQTELVPLAYRLSKEQDPQKTLMFAQRIIQLSLSAGSYENARRFIGEIIVSEEPTDHSDVVIYAGLLMSLRQYREALDVIDQRSPQTPREAFHLRILRAICLNRVRHHEEAESEIDDLLTHDLHPATYLVLSAYKISGRIHEDDMKGAESLFKSLSEEYHEHPFYSYFVRNAAAALPTEQAAQSLEGVLLKLRTAKDRFGVASVQNNLAAHYLELDKPALALPLLREAADLLALFGVHHLHIVENNLGYGLCKLGELEEAAERLKRARILSNSTFPNLYIRLNLALCQMCLGSESEALSELEKAREQLGAEDSFARLHQKYHINTALILAGLGVRQAEWQAFLDEAKVYPDRKSPETTRQAVRLIEGLPSGRTLSKQCVLRHFSPCTLEYWYFNPMDLVAEEMLSPDAESQDVLQ